MKSAYPAIYTVALCMAFLTVASAIDAHAQAANDNLPMASQSSAASNAVIPQDAKAAKAANRALRKTVMRQLSRTRGLVADGINVTAAGGVVTLLGTVPDTDQIDLAADVARDIAGVQAVRNGLTLQANGK
ncbi:BON domain-containing protein [Paraburkholderia pallida]|uniref:BON domain-containing protein n=1 Tax=Paraburkholderia pallida TaxID=2547399 RepID=A0A4P7D513_9BURK|nr:BON domain-containing protein [Paraburkholderia pallida]QBR01654.1 BON domain-containing protein [Paraburkholderia pallida]